MTCRPPNFWTAAVDQRADLFGVGDIRRLEEGVGAQRGGQCLGVIGVDVGDDDPRALGHKPLHRATTNTGRATGNDRYFAGKFVDHTDELIGDGQVKSSS